MSGKAIALFFIFFKAWAGHSYAAGYAFEMQEPDSGTQSDPETVIYQEITELVPELAKRVFRHAIETTPCDLLIGVAERYEEQLNFSQARPIVKFQDRHFEFRIDGYPDAPILESVREVNQGGFLGKWRIDLTQIMGLEGYAAANFPMPDMDSFYVYHPTHQRLQRGLEVSDKSGSIYALSTNVCDYLNFTRGGESCSAVVLRMLIKDRVQSLFEAWGQFNGCKKLLPHQDFPDLEAVEAFFRPLFMLLDGEEVFKSLGTLITRDEFFLREWAMEEWRQLYLEPSTRELAERSLTTLIENCNVSEDCKNSWLVELEMRAEVIRDLIPKMTELVRELANYILEHAKQTTQCHLMVALAEMVERAFREEGIGSPEETAKKANETWAKEKEIYEKLDLKPQRRRSGYEVAFGGRYFRLYTAGTPDYIALIAVREVNHPDSHLSYFIADLPKIKGLENYSDSIFPLPEITAPYEYRPYRHAIKRIIPTFATKMFKSVCDHLNSTYRGEGCVADELKKHTMEIVNPELESWLYSTESCDKLLPEGPWGELGNFIPSEEEMNSSPDAPVGMEWEPVDEDFVEFLGAPPY